MKSTRETTQKAKTKSYEKIAERQNGITLVALVITIIIIIILSTVTINMAFGENGLITQAKKAKDMTLNSVTAEQEGMNSVMSEYLNVMAEDSELPEPNPPADTTPPTVEIIVGERTENSIAITVNATDDSGEIASYKYYLNGTLKDTLTSNSYTFTGLTAGTDYTIKVEAYDKAGNKGEKSTTASTNVSYPTATEILEEGDYVTYPSPSGNIACRVLYDSTSGYGVQLITSSTVTNSYTLGSSNFTTSMNSYNNAISTLNSAVSSYNNSTYSTVRCVGSVPNNPSQDNAGYHTTQFGSGYDGQLKDTDTNYKTDYDQMGTLGIRNIGKSYWLASRYVNSGSINSNFRVRRVDSSGSLAISSLCDVYSSGNTYANSHSNGLRPCFTLKSGIKVTGGDGTSAGTAYTLGV